MPACGLDSSISTVSPRPGTVLRDNVMLDELDGRRDILTPPESPSSPWPVMMLDGKTKSQPPSGSPSETTVIQPSVSPGELQGLRPPFWSATTTAPITPLEVARSSRTSKSPTTPTSTQSLQWPSQCGSFGTSSSPASTAKTTLNSSGSGSSTGTIVHRRVKRIPSRSTTNHESSFMERINEHRFPTWPKEETTLPGVKPNIRTVETVSSAKFYIERQYQYTNSITPRARRWNMFEEQVRHGALVGDKLFTATVQYLESESNHLRYVRIAKSKTLTRKNCLHTSLAGFEVNRVLGKGSFGVVRLVRKRKSLANDLRVACDIHSPSKSPESVAMASIVHNDQGSPQTLRRQPCQFYAMKVIRKSAMLRGAQEGHLRAERDFLVLAERSRWVVHLEAAFQDNTNLYLVMEYMIGGDFLGLLLREDVLDERDAAFYIAEMILCVEESHRLGWIHRDVKPDNFLIDARGHLKVSDFGLSFDGDWSHNQGYYNAKRYDAARALNLHVRGDSQDAQEEDIQTRHREGGLPHTEIHTEQSKDEPLLHYMNRVNRRRYATSVVGTSQYMAPEVVRGDRYDGRCDWWSIGIILYECLYGRTPFYCESRFNTKERILRHSKYLSFPTIPRINQPYDRCLQLPEVSKTAVDFVSQLLVEREDRISSSRYKVNDRSVLKSSSRQAATPTRVQGTTSSSACLNSDGHSPRPRSLSNAGKTSFVYPDDARDIKRHAFFSTYGIDFDRIHHHEPPLRPRIDEDDSITKYFDEEHDIVSEGETDLEQSSDDSDVAGSLRQPRIQTRLARSKGISLTIDQQIVQTTGTTKTVQERKRPRDKILRDPHLGKVAMAIRKRRAFLGYTYRRPNIKYPEIDTERSEAPTSVKTEKMRRARPATFALPSSGPLSDSPPSVDVAPDDCVSATATA